MFEKNDPKWQPLLAVIDGGRIQCKCGDLAIILCVRNEPGQHDEKYLHLKEVSFWCQPCYSKTLWPDK